MKLAYIFLTFLLLAPMPALAAERSLGWEVIPRLPHVLRDVLGEDTVTFEAWQYYAHRLAAPHNGLANERQLVVAMEHWRDRGVAYPSERESGEDFVRSPGWYLLPHLSGMIREVFGDDHLTFDVWRYYATRIALPAERVEAIGSEQRLREVMHYWRGVQPEYPKGRDVATAAL